MWSDTENGFRDEYFFLSNMYPSLIKIGELKVQCSEILYQVLKVIDRDAKEILTDGIINGHIKNGYEAKKIARLCKLPKSDEYKIMCMRIALEYKFKNKELADMLIHTGDLELVEYNTWGDTFWGVCDGKGSNVLGNLLMEKRKELMGG